MILATHAIGGRWAIRTPKPQSDAGYALSPSILDDIIFAACIDEGIFNLFAVNQCSRRLKSAFHGRGATCCDHSPKPNVTNFLSAVSRPMISPPPHMPITYPMTRHFTYVHGCNQVHAITLIAK